MKSLAMWMLQLLLGQLLCLERVKSVCHEYYVGLVPKMNGRIQDYALIDKSVVRSIESCTEACFLNSSCVTFFYNSQTGQCQTHSVLLKRNSNDQRDDNWRYYQFYTVDCAPQDGLVLYRKENICYFLSNGVKSWNGANQECIKRGWRFLQIKTKEVQSHLSKTLAYYFENSGYRGCYKDEGNRAFSKGFGSFNNMSITWCREKCFENGYKYAGLQFSTFCFCGQEIYQIYGESHQCMMACAGNQNEICGSAYSSSVYMSAKYCYCGNASYDKYGKSRGCTYDCAGKMTEKCGGFWANSVYKVGGHYYTGLRNDNGVNKWSDGQFATGYFDWAPNQTFPTTDSCVFLEPLQDYKWQNRLCTDKLHFLCEKLLKRP